jgi:hypothetical protein
MMMLLMVLWNFFVATMYLARGWKLPPVLPFQSRARGRSKAFILILGTTCFLLIVPPPDVAVSLETEISLVSLSLAVFALYVLMALRKTRSTTDQPDFSRRPITRAKKAYFWDH